MEVKIINNSPNPLPVYKTDFSAGMDLQAHLSEPLVLQPGAKALVQTGLSIALPIGFEAQVRPRSGLALKNGITVLNSPGTIDADYRGAIGVILINHGEVPFEILPGDRIAQLIIAPITQIKWQPVADLDATARGAGGFGSTGI